MNAIMNAPSARQQRAFTLVELMVAITVLALLLVLAAPSFTNASLPSKLRSVANSLVGAAQLARSEAIKRDAVVTEFRASGGAVGNRLQPLKPIAKRQRIGIEQYRIAPGMQSQGAIDRTRKPQVGLVAKQGDRARCGQVGERSGKLAIGRGGARDHADRTEAGLEVRELTEVSATPIGLVRDQTFALQGSSRGVANLLVIV